MNDELDHLLTRLKLKTVHRRLDDELDHALRHQLSYQELLARLFREELNARQGQALESRVRRARLPERWALQTFPFEKQPTVHRATLLELAELDFVASGHNVVFIGPTGVGKTGLASALLLKALENGYRAAFVKAQDLFDEMFASLADRSTRSLLNRLKNLDALLIDELGYLNLRAEHTNIFFKLMEERYVLRKSTLITTNLDYDAWYDFLGNKNLVAALLDRIRHRCHTLRIDGVSLRSPLG